MAEVVDVIKNDTENIMQSIIVANPTKKIVYDDGSALYLIETEPYSVKDYEISDYSIAYLMPCIIAFDGYMWGFVNQYHVDPETKQVDGIRIDQTTYVYDYDLHAYKYLQEPEEP